MCIVADLSLQDAADVFVGKQPTAAIMFLHSRTVLEIPREEQLNHSLVTCSNEPIDNLLDQSLFIGISDRKFWNCWNVCVLEMLTVWLFRLQEQHQFLNSNQFTLI